MNILPWQPVARTAARTAAWLVTSAALLLSACGGDRGPAAASEAARLADLRSEAAGFQGHGVWWNPAESGTGFVFEAQGATGVATFFLYEDTGRPVWYSGSGAISLDAQGRTQFAATLVRFSGGQTAGSVVPRAPVPREMGALRIVFDGLSAQVSLPGRAFSAVKFNASPTQGTAGVPEPGIYWSPLESGRGYTMEVANGAAMVGVFHYDSDGEPTWNLVQGTMAGGALRAPFTRYQNGQTLAGAYRAPQALATTQQFEMRFSTACQGTVQFPGMAPVAVTRFAFGGLPAGAECRSSPVAATACTPGVSTGFTRSIEQALADTGAAGAGGGGDGGDGGGAAAGGGLGKVLGGRITVTDLATGAAVGSALTDASGLVTVRSCNLTGPFLVAMEGQPGARYFDEGLGTLADFGPGQVLHALVEQWNEHVGVSPLTEAAYRHALNQWRANPADVAAGRTPLLRTGSLTGLTRAQVAQANAAVLGAVNAALVDSARLPSVNTLPVPIDMASAPDALKPGRYGVSAMVNGGIVASARKYAPASPTPALDAAQYLADDLTDGVLNGYALDGRAVSFTTSQAVESSRFSIASAVGQNAISQRFGQALFTRAPAIAEFLKTRAENSVDGLLVLRKDGSLAASLYNANNPIVQEQLLTGVNQINWGHQASYAMTADGSVWAWGRQACGALGNGLITDEYIDRPQRIAGLANIKKIANTNVGGYALDAFGSVYSWGGDLHGLLGRGANTGAVDCTDLNRYPANPTPQRIPTLTRVRDVTAGQLNAYATTVDGRVYVWGTSTTAAGVYDPINVPREVPGLSNVVQLAANGTDVIAVLSDGRVFGWGFFGAVPALLGLGNNGSVPTPTLLPGLAGDRVVQVAGDSSQMFAVLLATGEIRFWTYNTGTVPVRPKPGETSLVTMARNAFGTLETKRTLGTLPAIRQIAGSKFGIIAYGVNGEVYEMLIRFTCSGCKDEIDFVRIDPDNLLNHQYRPSSF